MQAHGAACIAAQTVECRRNYYLAPSAHEGEAALYAIRVSRLNRCATRLAIRKAHGDWLFLLSWCIPGVDAGLILNRLRGGNLGRFRHCVFSGTQISSSPTEFLVVHEKLIVLVRLV